MNIKTLLKGVEMPVAFAIVVAAALGITWRVMHESKVSIPLTELTKEYPYVSLDEAFDSEVADIFCPPHTKCPGLITMVKLTSKEKRTLQVHRDVSDTLKLHKVLVVGTRIVKYVHNDTLYVYANTKSMHKFVIDRKL